MFIIKHRWILISSKCLHRIKRIWMWSPWPSITLKWIELPSLIWQAILHLILPWNSTAFKTKEASSLEVEMQKMQVLFILMLNFINNISKQWYKLRNIKTIIIRPLVTLPTIYSNKALGNHKYTITLKKTSSKEMRSSLHNWICLMYPWTLLIQQHRLLSLQDYRLFTKLVTKLKPRISFAKGKKEIKRKYSRCWIKVWIIII